MLKHNSVRLERIRACWERLARNHKLELRDELRSEVKWLRSEVGALNTNKKYQVLYEEIKKQPGYVYLQKIYIDSELFENYERVFPRWPHMRLHAAAIFDGASDGGTGMVYEMEGPWIADAREFLEAARAAERGVKDFRKRARKDQLEALRFARASILASLNFVEAYLNGLAYDCFHEYHAKLPLKDHDLLAEWDSDQKRRRFVDFREKVFRYPVIVGQQRGLKVDLSGCQAAHGLVGSAKEYRDALVHPSPFIDPHSREFRKFFVAVGANRGAAEQVLGFARDYARFVEKAIGNKVELSAPWLSDDQRHQQEELEQALKGEKAGSKVPA